MRLSYLGAVRDVEGRTRSRVGKEKTAQGAMGVQKGEAPGVLMLVLVLVLVFGQLVESCCPACSPS